MYLKTENLTLVLIFDKLEHFRCFCRDGGACPPLGEICEKPVKTGEMGTEVPDPFLQAKW